MPTYRYECSQCGEKFKLRRPSTKRDAGAECPSCNSSQTNRAMSKFAVGSTDQHPEPACEPRDCSDGTCPFA